MRVLALCVCLLGAFCSSSAEENYQKWSAHTKLGENYTFTCNDTYRSSDKKIEVEADDTVQWRRKDHSEYIMMDNNDHYELIEIDGIPRMGLKLVSINRDMKGIYLCEVFNSSSQSKGFVVKGLNLGGHKYDDPMDEFEDQIIVGLITAGSVLFVILAVGLIENFRYLTDEQKQKRRDRKAERLEKQRRWENGGHDNKAADLDMTEESRKSYDVANGQKEANTHL